MRLIITGCEYAGKSTLLGEIKKWAKSAMGGLSFSGHDHFEFPSKELPEDERQKLLILGPKAKEMFQRYMITYHLHPEFYRDNDHVLVGFHIEEAVYAPLYYGYDRRPHTVRSIEKEIMEIAPDTVLVLMKASAETIRKRMKDNSHPYVVLKDKDVEYVLKRFDEEYENSLIRRRFILDTTNFTIEETFKKFLELMEPHFTVVDRLRILLRKRSTAKTANITPYDL